MFITKETIVINKAPPKAATSPKVTKGDKKSEPGAA